MRPWTMLPATAIALTTSAGALSTSSGCFGMSCTAIYVAPGLTIELQGNLVDGDHVIEVVADGRALALDVALTPNDPGCGDGTAACRDEEDGMVLDQEFSLHPRVAYLDDARGGPATVELTVLRDGAIIHTTTLQPSYETREPNGRGCGEVTTAREVVVIP